MERAREIFLSDIKSGIVAWGGKDKDRIKRDDRNKLGSDVEKEHVLELFAYVQSVIYVAK